MGMAIAFGKHAPGFFIQALSEGIMHGLLLCICFGAFTGMGMSYDPSAVLDDLAAVVVPDVVN
jgi:hypothetical protein